LAGYGSKKFYDMSKPKVVKDSWAERNLDPSLGTALGAASIGAGGVGTVKLLNKLFANKGADAADPIVQLGRFSNLSETLKNLGLKAGDRNARPIQEAYNQYARSMSSHTGRFLTTLNNLFGGRLENMTKPRMLKIPPLTIKGRTYFSGINTNLTDVIKNAIRNQRDRDVNLAEALHHVKNRLGNVAGGNFDRNAAVAATKGFKSLWSNPRKVINASRNSKGALRAFGVSGAALLAALLAKSVSKDRQQ
jgi:hypothetical protein